MLRKRSAPILAAADRGLEPGTSDPTPLPLQNQTSQAEEGASGPEGASFPTDHPGEFFWERAERGLPELRLQPTAKLLPRERVQGSLALHPPHPFPAVFQELKSPERLRAVRATAPGESGRAVPGGGKHLPLLPPPEGFTCPCPPETDRRTPSPEALPIPEARGREDHRYTEPTLSSQLSLPGEIPPTTYAISAISLSLFVPGAVTQRLGARTTNCDEEPASSEKRACVVQLRRRGPEADS
ncbi:uncharacterized protein [Notamacropus eugenii]|uniref:uncharacterized protein isoform X2 n=1 Tax=Notamacropus eugenii TaxID=9315 RepID=UPI003B67E544